MIWYFIGVYIINRTLHSRFSCWKIFHSFATLIREIFLTLIRHLAPSFEYFRYSQLSQSDHFSQATTSRKRPLRKQPFCFSVKYCFKSSLVSDHHSKFLRDRDHFLGQKFDIFFCFLFPVSDHPTYSRMIWVNNYSKATKAQFLMTLPRTPDSLQTEKITIMRSVGKWELLQWSVPKCYTKFRQKNE